MGLFHINTLSDESTNELQARLRGLCAVAIANGYFVGNQAKEYQELITELARRKVTPEATLVPREVKK